MTVEQKDFLERDQLGWNQKMAEYQKEGILKPEIKENKKIILNEIERKSKFKLKDEIGGFYDYLFEDSAITEDVIKHKKGTFSKINQNFVNIFNNDNK